jgi:hypothetical protein
MKFPSLSIVGRLSCVLRDGASDPVSLASLGSTAS